MVINSVRLLHSLTTQQQSEHGKGISRAGKSLAVVPTCSSPRFLTNTPKAVAGDVDQGQALGAVEEVEQLSVSRPRGCLDQRLSAHDGIEKRRLADITPTDKGELDGGWLGEMWSWRMPGKGWEPSANSSPTSGCW